MIDKTTPNGDRADTAAYIADLSGHMAKMARNQGLETLGYILDMAKLAAEEAIQGERRNGGDRR